MTSKTLIVRATFQYLPTDGRTFLTGRAEYQKQVADER